MLFSAERKCSGIGGGGGCAGGDVVGEYDIGGDGRSKVWSGAEVGFVVVMVVDVSRKR